MAPHLTDDQLLEVTLGRATPEAHPELHAHLQTCGACRERQEATSREVFANTVAGPATRPDAPAALGATMERGTTLGRYVLLEKLGAGGMGDVFAAYDPQLDRKVALKLLRAGSLSATEGRTRLLREAQAMARLAHPNVIAVHDVGTLGDRVFIAMEFVEGETLTEWLRAARPWPSTLRVFLEAGGGLAAAHRAGLVHRDFKPDNVLLGPDGRPRVLDFGLARQTQSTPAAGVRPELTPEADTQVDHALSVPLTRDGAVMGTPGYMAPEQIAGLPTDARTDQFAFCVALYEALTGKRPFGGSTLRQHSQEIAEGRILPPPAGSQVPAWLWEPIRRGLSADPGQRFGDMEALLAALRPRQRQRWRTTALAASLAVLATAGIGWAALTQQRVKVCGGVDARLTDGWNEPARAKLQAAFEGTKLAWAPEVWRNTERVLDAWALDWSNASHEACEAAKVRRVDSEELYLLKRACLDERLERFHAFTNLLEVADRDVVANAITAARSLEPVTSCFDVAALSARHRAVDQQHEEAARELRKVLAQAQSLHDAGKYAQAIALLEQHRQADAPEAVLAEVALLQGRSLVRLSKAREARAANLQAAEYATTSGDAQLEAISFSRLFASEGYDEADVDAEAWGRLSHAAAARVPGRWEVEAELAQNDALVGMRSQHPEDAQANYERALTLLEEHLGAEHPRVAMVLNNLGVCLTRTGRYDEAIEKYERALKLHRALEGDAHPNVATAEHNLATALRKQGRYTEALQHYENAWSIRRGVLGPDNKDTLNTLQALARTEISLGRLEVARAHLDEVLSRRQAAGGDNTRELAQTYDLFAELYLTGHHWKEAAEASRSGVELLHAQKVAGQPLSTALMRLGVGQTKLGQWAEAQRSLDEALKLRREATGDTSNDVAAVLNAQADLLLGQRRVEEASARYAEALALREQVPGGPLPEALAGDLEGVGRCALASSKPGEAVKPLERAVGLLLKVENPGSLATSRAALGEALWLSTPEERPRAVELWRLAHREGAEEVRTELATFWARNGLSATVLEAELDAGAP
jgi:serine/threonine-protein kinase